MPNSNGLGAAKDTSMNKSNNGTWKDEEARISWEQLYTAKIFKPDTAIHAFQRRGFLEGWAHDLGNLGSPVEQVLFSPENLVGPSLGYHVFDAYRFDLDSQKYYNTNRPYSVFNYQLGSKLEQVAGIMHTQNVRPNWNFMVDYRKINSPGFYKTQRTNHDNFTITSNYKTLDKHYTLYTAFVYNKEQQDENGGAVADSELANPLYTDRKTMDMAYQNNQYSLNRSPVSNVQRDFGLLLNHSYTWGNMDTTYSKDSTNYTYKLVPRFSITHQFSLRSEKHSFKDLSPDSLRYTTLFNASFPVTTHDQYYAGTDSVFTQEKWLKIDNRLLLNGFLGKEGRQLKFSAGAGIRFDQFISQPVNNGIQLAREKTLSNYVMGEIKKEALKPGQWQYDANATLYVTGDYAGNLSLNAKLGRDFKQNAGAFVVGAGRQLGSSPYNYAHYDNPYINLTYSFNRESISSIYAMADLHKWRLSGGVRNYLIDNYIFINSNGQPAQCQKVFNVDQAWLRKVFKLGSFFIDNELVYQLSGDNTPINLPMLMGRHQFSFERALFNNAIKISTGLEVKYNTPYYASGYDPLLNRFFYQHSRQISDTPEMSLFLNFRVKHFRAFIMGDQMQQLFANNTIYNTGIPIYNFFGTGNTNTPSYTAPNLLIRFGFNWVLVN